MPRGAGYYRDRLRIHTQDTTKNSQGQEVETWTAGDYVWGRVEITGGRRGEAYGSTQTGVDATIRFRGMPSVSALDHVHQGDVVWVLESIFDDGTDLIANAQKYDSNIQDG